MSVGLIEDDPSYCNSRKRPAFDAVCVVKDFVVVRASKTKVAYESFDERGVDEKERNDDRRCERMVDFPDPFSPLYHKGSWLKCLCCVIRGPTYRNRTAWFSPREANRVKARFARSSASAIALPSLAPSGPLVGEVYVLSNSRAWEERRAVGSPTWNLLLDGPVSYSSMTRVYVNCHTGLQDEQSDGYLTANAQAMMAATAGHASGGSLLGRPCCVGVEDRRCDLTI